MEEAHRETSRSVSQSISSNLATRTTLIVRHRYRFSAHGCGIALERKCRVDELTPRERDVLELIAEGASNLAIGEILAISVSYVERLTTDIFWKLDLEERPDTNRRVLAAITYIKTTR